MSEPTKLFRKGVCGIFINQEGKILLGERTNDPGQWQLPQGGLEKEETSSDALVREMHEECNIENIFVLRQTQQYISYEWPKELLKQGKHAGQQHIYYLIDGTPVKIETLQPTEEFKAFAWHTPQEVLQMIVPWKKPMYEQAFKELKIIK